MPRSALTGTRIRARRTARGLRQAELARAVGVSPSYLNLIEHNRRRAGNELLAALAEALEVAPDALLEGGEGAQIEQLRAAASRMAPGAPDPELDRIEEFLGRFPGWAHALAEAEHRIEALERVIAQLSDRMAHDPNLPAAMHEIVSAVTAVQSTAAILADTDDIEHEWRQKFHANILADSIRLADGAEALVRYLESAGADETGLAAPQEELEAWLGARRFHLPELEGSDAANLDELVAGQAELASDSARVLARHWLTRYRADALALPMDALLSAVARHGIAPDLLAREFGTGLDRVLRRLAAMPPGQGMPDTGLILADGSGTMTFRRPVDGFTLPRFGGGCPLWPLYQVLQRPLQPMRQVIETAGRIPQRFTAHAICTPQPGGAYDLPPVLEATMLIVRDAFHPEDGRSARPPGSAQPVLVVGASCRVCPQRVCPARREPSILSG